MERHELEASGVLSIAGGRPAKRERWGCVAGNRDRRRTTSTSGMKGRLRMLPVFRIGTITNVTVPGGAILAQSGARPSSHTCNYLLTLAACQFRSRTLYPRVRSRELLRTDLPAAPSRDPRQAAARRVTCSRSRIPSAGPPARPHRSLALDQPLVMHRRDARGPSRAPRAPRRDPGASTVPAPTSATVGAHAFTRSVHFRPLRRPDRRTLRHKSQGGRVAT